VQHAATQLTIVFDVAVLQRVTVDGVTLDPGAQQVSILLHPGEEHMLQWDSTKAALVRVRVFDREVDLPALQSVPLRIEPRIDDSDMVLQGIAGDVQLQGIEDATGKAVTYPIPGADSIKIAAGVTLPLADGHYQVVVLSPHGQRIVVANLWIKSGAWRWQAIPLPLTLVY
jgi:hypothetical protein